MLFYPSEAPVLAALVWPSQAVEIALMYAALAAAAVLGWLALRDRRRRRRRLPVAPPRMVPRPRRLAVARAESL